MAHLARQRRRVVGLQAIGLALEDLSRRLGGGGVERLLQLQEPLRGHRLVAKALHGLGDVSVEVGERFGGRGRCRDCPCRRGRAAGTLDNHEDSFPWEFR